MGFFYILFVEVDMERWWGRSDCFFGGSLVSRFSFFAPETCGLLCNYLSFLISITGAGGYYSLQGWYFPSLMIMSGYITS